jgi:REP element-mobilizing transposase RayT
MSHTYLQLYYHFVWSAKGREDLLAESELRTWLINAIERQCRKRGGTCLACNVMPDHVHLLVELEPTVAVATFIGQVKGAVSHLAEEWRPGVGLDWQEGYGALTLRRADLGTVAAYIRDQAAIHAARRIKAVLERAGSDAQP